MAHSDPKAAAIFRDLLAQEARREFAIPPARAQRESSMSEDDNPKEPAEAGSDGRPS